MISQQNLVQITINSSELVT